MITKNTKADDAPSKRRPLSNDRGQEETESLFLPSNLMEIMPYLIGISIW